MTTDNADFRIEVAPNLFEPNPCLRLTRPTSSDSSTNLACITILRDDAQVSRSDASWSCLLHAWTSIFRHGPPLKCWLNACVRQENTRIARHQGLWKTLVKQGLPRTVLSTAEVMVENDDNTLGFYGAIGVDGEWMQVFRPVVTAASRSFLTLLPRDDSAQVELLIGTGWRRGLVQAEELSQIATIVAMQGGVLLRLFGEFDDREAGVDCIMNPELYRQILSKVSR